MMMDLEELRQILDLARQHELTELELERDGFKIRIKKDGLGMAVRPGVSPTVDVTAPVPGGIPAAAPAALSPPATSPPPVVSPAAPASVPEATGEGVGVELAVIKSPIVGTFYRAPEPGARPFVEVGQTVRQGQVLCIIEAMKLMNEIESEYSGEVASIYAENGQPVQYGERLFAIRIK